MASDPPVLIEAMSNKQLKELISKAGLPTADLFEKKDLRARAHEAALCAAEPRGAPGGFLVRLLLASAAPSHCLHHCTLRWSASEYRGRDAGASMQEV